MESIAFIDTEIDPKSKTILDIGAVNIEDNSFHSTSVSGFIDFLKGTKYICGHNILNHDIKYINKSVIEAGINSSNIIDTLYLSPLLFPEKPYHKLLKDDKLQTDDSNNPLNDSIKARDLFFDEVSEFNKIDDSLKQILYLLLFDKKEFSSFFKYISYKSSVNNVEPLINSRFNILICENAKLTKIIWEYPIELAYCLSIINCKNRYSITPRWVLKNYPDVDKVMFWLRNNPCITGCEYCNQALDVRKGLKDYFGFDSFRLYAGEPLQENATQAAIENKSLLAIFPTGGGKSITFQVPALMNGVSVRGLTVIISPLQSLMKDQVDNLEKAGITDAVTINGLLDPIEKGKSFERVEDGSASILYISPESLRSKSIERLLLGRKLVRFVIDEAHCFSSWGQDFRVDYLYIGDFIKSIQEKKNLDFPIPVSCFTATAKQKVIEDICTYFREKLSLELEIFSSSASRTNLKYKVFQKSNDEEKYNSLRDLIEEKNCPTIIYVSRTRRAYLLAERLFKDGHNAKPYHGKMDSKEKSANQNAFISGEVQIMVATSAFGMGVDKKDVGMVIHYEISDSLENYIQEAGRAGRDENITADCYILFNDEDLGKHFILLNQTKISLKEIQQIWRAIKDITRFRSTVSNSALEIARKAGWDDNVAEIETRVTTAIAALEDAGYLKRGQNMPRIFANSILTKTSQDAIDKINASDKFEEKQKEKGVRIIKKLFSSKSRKQSGEDDGESRVDYISDHLGIVKEEVINIINLLREENILADAKDLTAFIKKSNNKNQSFEIVKSYSKIEKYLLNTFEEKEKTFNLKELNENAEKNDCTDINLYKIKTVINFLAIKNWIKRHNEPYSNNNVSVQCIQPKDKLKEKSEKRLELAKFIVEQLYAKIEKGDSSTKKEKEEILVEFSVHELKNSFEKRNSLFKTDVTIQDIEETLFFLSRIEAIKIEGGFMVVYNKLTIERLEEDNKKSYKVDDYKKLNQFYANKIQQIHIAGEYAKKMIEDYKGALQFADDYFQLNYTSFLNKYFPGSERQDEINRNITPAKFHEMFGTLNPTQLEIIKDNKSKYIVVAAGPGSGKTRVLVNKLASLLLMEDIKHEQLLMLTFSRAATTEFKKRLVALIGNAANYIDIKTFHSFCFDLLGKVGSLEKSDTILKTTLEKIRNKEVEPNRITKTVLVIDEAQDMTEDEFNLIYELMIQNEGMRVVAVGDDDQNIYEFRGSDSKYLEKFITSQKAEKRELILNYRSKINLVEYSNEFAKKIEHRLKENSIESFQKDTGKIKIVKYKTRNLITPLVNDILNADISGTSCILTKTNEEAMQITGLLLINKMNAKLIQSNDGFSLYDLDEVRFFVNKIKSEDDVYNISDENWDKAKRALNEHFGKSSKIEICSNIIRDFEATNTKKKYKSDFDVFIKESKLEDFFNTTGETFFVSTIHKAKGKEFDNVFIMLDKFDSSTDEAKRLLYVAMTRAKNNLTIHYNGKYLENIFAENMKIIEDNHVYQSPGHLAMHLSFKEVWLDYFIKKQYFISKLISGDTLLVKETGCTDKRGNSILKFSKTFIEKMEELLQKGYKIKEAKVNFIVSWKKKETSQEIKIILPEIIFEREQ